MTKAVKEAAHSASQTTAAVAATRADQLLTIGQVVAQLKHDFPDLSITKVRYLEDRGLLAPARTPGRYRKYSAADVRRLRTILTLQRDEYLPLEVIRQRVERVVVPVSGRPLDATSAPIRTTPALKKEEPAYTLEEAPDAAGVDEQFFRMLAEYRLIDKVSPTGPALTESDLEIARICHLLARFGVEPRNLRLLSSSAEREAALIDQVTTPSLRSTHLDKREYGEKMLEDLGALLSQLLHLLLYKELRKLL
ncbi:MAG: MerR family transcriptional regulator [Actinobacteria bacterium]|nr:MerR family transcriptional regulator [Actinomycetota bacterium]